MRGLWQMRLYSDHMCVFSKYRAGTARSLYPCQHAGHVCFHCTIVVFLLIGQLCESFYGIATTVDKKTTCTCRSNKHEHQRANTPHASLATSYANGSGRCGEAVEIANDLLLQVC